jgi:ABC-type uncharacterized transport system ATPase subunit
VGPFECRQPGVGQRKCPGSYVEIAYGGIHAVKGIDLHVDKGELVCLIGTNGAGKTTRQGHRPATGQRRRNKVRR